ncbi:DUF3703 domain-containing protein [Aliidiomarina soli]|uniref:DUF3703 domain-containing protein n=1 Tax=Aliidiomarina soli TaxID=1928574 RepID=A0A432WMC2_9GAMM|nr:DUF3703 domain-containing protein [Aliidiomarina soli]RUO34839.1 hypothetical protein CWE14_02245 [Aliidiomarina soli]
MKPELATAFNKEMTDARMAWTARDLSTCFRSLERAHILGQRNLWPHILTHGWMLRVGWARCDYREVVGQILRLIATLPGALFGWVPEGNTGGANVSALKPMPVPDEFKPYFAKNSMLKGMLLRVLIISVIMVLMI